MPGTPGTNDRARTVLLMKFDLRLVVEPRRNRVVAASHPELSVFQKSHGRTSACGVRRNVSWETSRSPDASCKYGPITVLIPNSSV
jgi:hypothetical protein